MVGFRVLLLKWGILQKFGFEVLRFLGRCEGLTHKIFCRGLFGRPTKIAALDRTFGACGYA